MWKEYENILAKEELLWFQKSRSKLLELGDRNTEIFHGVTAIRRRKNYIEALQVDQGRLINDPVHLENLATTYFQNLFDNEGEVIPYHLAGHFPVGGTVPISFEQGSYKS